MLLPVHELNQFQAVAQSQKTVYRAWKDCNEQIQSKADDGTPTEEVVFLFQPKSFLVIGRLDEFIEEHGINQAKFGSFELYRKNCQAPEILTFDELYERARFIVEHDASQSGDVESEPQSIFIDEPAPSDTFDDSTPSTSPLYECAPPENGVPF